MNRAIRLIASIVMAAAFAGVATAQPVRFLGGTEQVAGGFAIQWPGSGFEAEFEGTRLTAVIDDWGSNWLNVEVDGVVKPLGLFEGEKTYTLFEGAPGRHTIRVTRRTGTPVGVTRFLSIAADGSLKPTPAPSQRILVIGDSLASGFGIEGADQKCRYSHATQNADLAWPALIGRSLGADIHNVSADGLGLIRNFGGSGQPAMQTVAWQNLVDSQAAWAALAWQPQVVVIALGSADFTDGDPGDAFDDAYLLLIRKLRVAYPDAVIVGTIGGSLWGKRYEAAKTSVSGAVETVRKGGDEKVRFLEFKLKNGEGRYGCDSHPGIKASGEMAAQLQAEIEKTLGWRPAAEPAQP